MCSINNLTVIVDSKGEYITRGGDKVIIHEIKYPNDISYGSTVFPCKGVLYIKKKVKTVKRFNAWHVSGRIYPYKESKFDIIGKMK